MRAAYVCADPGIPVFGRKGASVHVQEVVRAMVRRGHDVALFAARLGGDCPSDLAAIRVYRLPAASEGDPAARERAALAANLQLADGLRTAGPFDLVYERYALWSFAGMEFARMAETPGLLEVNAPLIEEQATYRELVDRQAAKEVAGRVFSAATVLIAVSDGVRDYLERFPAAVGRVRVVPNGVNADRFPANIRPSSPQLDAFTVGFLGTLKPWHGLPVLIDAFDRLHQQDPSTRLLIVGDGTERANLERDLAQRGLLRVAHFTGAVPPDAVAGWLASMDVGVAPYPDQDQFYFSPLKVMEYMAAGLPIVASRIGQLRDLIEDGQTGLLCPPGDSIALAETLNRLRRAPALRARLGRKARETALADRTWDAVVERIFGLAGVAAPSEPSPVEVGS